MAKSKNNVVTYGLSGKVGDLLIFRQVGGKTVVSQAVERTDAATEKQKEQRKRFQRAVIYARVAPFKYDSGTTVHSRSRISQRAGKSIKALLHMAAVSVATGAKGELHEYYVKKVNEGKNKMSVLNAVRAKLVPGMFAVIKNDVQYEKNYVNPLA
jgi:hypothetical protein